MCWSRTRRGGGLDQELHVRCAGALGGDADVRLHGVGYDECDEPGERDGDISIRRVASGDEADGREAAGDAVHVRRVRASEAGAALGSNVQRVWSALYAAGADQAAGGLLV